MTKYKYEMMVGNSMAEMVHGTITQQQAHFWEANFGKHWQEVLQTYVFSWDKEEIEDAGIIPKEMWLPHWHDIDDYEHLNAPYYNYAYLSVTDEKGKNVGDFVETVTKHNQVVKMEGHMIDTESYEPTIDDGVHLYAYSHEKGSFDLLSYDDDGNNESKVVELNNPFDIKNMSYSCTTCGHDVFLTGASYNDDGNIIEFELMSEYSHGKSSGLWIEEDTLTQEKVDVPKLSMKKKVKLLELLGYEGYEMENALHDLKELKKAV